MISKFFNAGRLSLVPISFVLLNACASNNISFRQSVVPPLPNVLAGENQFKLTFAVENPTANPVAVHELTVRANSLHFTNQKSGACTTEHEFQNPLLQANGGHWVVEDFEFSKTSFGISDPCYCAKSTDCWGIVFLRLNSSASGNQLPGPRTRMQVTFEGSGGLSDLTVVDLSD